MTCRKKAGLLLLAFAPLAARAEQWTLENTFATRYEVNDNAALAATSPGTMNTLSLSSQLSASRRSEAAATSLRAAMTALQERGPGENDRMDGQWGLSHKVDGPLYGLALSALYLRDLNNALDSGDVLVGRARRRSRQYSGSLSHSLAERFSLSAQLSQERTGYGASGTSDYENLSVGGSLTYRLDERQTWSLDVSRARYRTNDGSQRSTTDQVGLGWQMLWSERQSLSASIGQYETRSDGLRSGLACPLAPAYCIAGYLPYVIVSVPVHEVQRGLQFNLSQRLQLDEAGEFSFGAARQQSPSGAGVVARRETLSAQLSRSWSERSSGSAGYLRTQATYHAFGGDARRMEQSLSFAFNHRLADDFSLQVGLKHLRADGGTAGTQARANSASLSISYDWPRLSEAR